MTDYAGVKATVLGLGTFGGGIAAVQFLVARGAIVTITDLRNEEQLQTSLEQLDDVSVSAVYLGAHPDKAFDGAELLVVNPAVKPDNSVVQRCRRHGTVISSEIELFLRHNSARVVAVTGSNGKSTTAALIHQLITPQSRDDGHAVWLGGNIGNSLLPSVDDICPTDIVVLELSSFQLHYLSHSRFAPCVAVITNFAANHLDWHSTIDHYQASKQLLFRCQTHDDIAILPDDQDDSRVWRIRCEQLRFGESDHGEDGAFLEDGTLVLRRGNFEDAVRIDRLSALPGAHNRKNVAAAACAAWSLGAAPDSFRETLAGYRSLPHRLQLVAQGRGLCFYNDSLATTPESTIAALRSFSQACVIIAGGSDKGVDLRSMAEEIHQRAAAAVLIGGTANKLAESLAALASDDRSPSVSVATDLENAFSLAVAVAPQGSIVLLSPGCASYDWFRDFRERGDRFTNLALQWLKE